MCSLRGGPRKFDGRRFPGRFGCRPRWPELCRDHGALPGRQPAGCDQFRCLRLDTPGGRNLHGELLHQQELDVVRPRDSRRWRRSDDVRGGAERHIWNRGPEQPGDPARRWYRQSRRWRLEQWSVDPEPLHRDTQHSECHRRRVQHGSVDPERFDGLGQHRRHWRRRRDLQLRRQPQLPGLRPLYGCSRQPDPQQFRRVGQRRGVRRRRWDRQRHRIGHDARRFDRVGEHHWRQRRRD